MQPVKSHIAQSLEPKRLKDALTIVRLASLAPNADALRKNVLDKLCHNLRVDKGIFILPSDNGQFTDFWGKNTEDKYHEQFKAHFYKYDPFSLIPGHMQRKCVVCLDELVSYPTFLKSA